MLPLLWFGLFFAPQETPPQRCALSGTVVDSITEKPLGKVELELEPLDHAATHTAVAISDSEGRFSMVDLDPGRYHLKGSRSGYLEAFFGARRHDSPGTVIRLEAGQALDDLKFKLPPAAVIAGVVRDSDGEPLEGAHVVIARRSATYGRPRIESFDSVDTDDEGRYRFGKLPPGKYYVAAEPKSRGWDKVDHSPAPTGPVTALTMTLYPGAPDVATAAPVEVTAGARVAGIDITMLRRRVYRVTGRVVNANGPVSLTLRNQAEIGIHDFDPHTVTKAGAGDFEMRGIPPGAYLLSGGKAIAAVVVGATDVEGVRLALGPGAAIQGHVMVEPVEGRKPVDPGGLRIFFTTDGRRGAMPPVEDNDTFTTALEPGHYEVRVGNLPKSVYLKSIRSGDIDVLSEGLDVGASGILPLEIVLAMNGGAIEGIVLSAEGSPVAGATVLLAPSEKLRTRRDLFRSATTDQSGRYAFDAIAPEEYSLFAWEEVEQDAWNDPGFLRNYEKQGEPLKLQAKDRTTVKLRLIPVIP